MTLVACEQLDEGYRVLLEAQEFYKQEKNVESLANNYTNLATACLKTNRFSEARTYNTLAISTERDLGSDRPTQVDEAHSQILSVVEKLIEEVGINEAEKFLKEHDFMVGGKQAVLIRDELTARINAS